MTSMEAFLGADTVARPSSGMVMASGQPVRSVSSARPSSGFVMATGKALYEAQQFTDAAIVPNPNNQENGATMRQFMRTLAEAKASNNLYPAINAFISTLRGTRDLMRSALKSGLMTDAATQRIADRIALGNLMLQQVSNALPSGVPAASATQAEQLISEIDSMVAQLQAKRNADYQRVMTNKMTAQSAIASFNAMPDTNSQVPGGGSVDSPYVPGSSGPDSVPGGGAAGMDVAVEKTAMQKFGPVLALVAGGIAAYYAFK